MFPLIPQIYALIAPKFYPNYTQIAIESSIVDDRYGIWKNGYKP